MAIAPLNLGGYVSTPNKMYTGYGEHIISGGLPSVPFELCHASRIKSCGRDFGGQLIEEKNVNASERLYNPGQLFPLTIARTIGKQPHHNSSKFFFKTKIRGNRKNEKAIQELHIAIKAKLQLKMGRSLKRLSRNH
jgi:hypothetical protein